MQAAIKTLLQTGAIAAVGIQASGRTVIPAPGPVVWAR